MYISLLYKQIWLSALLCLQTSSANSTIVSEMYMTQEQVFSLAGVFKDDGNKYRDLK